jgi:hypothetical protein
LNRQFNAAGGIRSGRVIEVPVHLSERRGRMPLSQEDLAERARISMAMVTGTWGAKDFEEDARDALQRLTEDKEVAARHPRAIEMLRRALAVNMNEPANRKGDLPRALGFINRRSKATRRKHQAIIRMIDYLQDYCDPNAKDGAGMPYLTVSQAAQAVVQGFYEAGIDTTLTADNVEQIYSRFRGIDATTTTRVVASMVAASEIFITRRSASTPCLRLAKCSN